MRTHLFRIIFAALIGAALLPDVSVGQRVPIDTNDVTVGVSGIAYRTQTGDTLMAIATRFTGAARNWTVLGHLNGISENTRIPIGTALQIPANLLLDQPVDAHVVAISGAVTVINADKTTHQLQEGARISEGMQINTAGNSFVTLKTIDGSRISIPSNTLVRVSTLRATLFTRSPRTAITILHGAVDSIVSPLKQNKGSFQILSPSATAAVRGTHFRVEVLPNGSTAHALYDGVIALERRPSQDRLTLQAGYGNVTSKQVLAAPVRLLAAPQLSAAPTLYGNAQLSLSITPLTGAAAYHVHLASDNAATHPLIETRTATPKITLNKVVEGNYSLRISAVDINGIEGFSSVIPVALLKQPAPTADNTNSPNTPSAPWIASVEAQQFTLTWRSGVAAGFRLQIAHDSDFTWLLTNATSTNSELRLPRPPFGTYYARVQQQHRDGSVGPFSAVQSFVVTDQWIIPDGLPRPATPTPLH